MRKIMSEITTEKKGNKMVISRLFDAPRELVFEVYSNCNHLMKWYGGEGWPLAKCELDFKVGGKWTYCFDIAGEGLTCGMAIYKEIEKPYKIAYKDHFLDEDGSVSKELPSSLITFEFTESEGKTLVTNTWEYPSDADLDQMIEMGAVEGITDIWMSLENYLLTINEKEI